MAALFKSVRVFRGCIYLNKSNRVNVNNGRSMCTIVQPSKPRSLLRISLIGAGVGVTMGAIYSYNKIREIRKNLSLEGTQLEIVRLKHKPPITPSRQEIYPTDATDLKLTLFQYQTCPFCCKVRVLLDYYGISYDVVEVDPVLRSQISWSSYKKVPILLAKIKDGYQPLNDSSMIISLIASYLNDTSHSIEELANYYPTIAMFDESGAFRNEIINKYFLMYKNATPKDKTMNDIVEERKWRQWADNVLVHTLSPNVYRTLDEAYQAFQWFSNVGKWEEYFPWWERMLIINIGACAMWIIGKRLKKRHHLKDDVRLSLYDEVNRWLREIKARGTLFMGGHDPDLSDLAVYGILKSIEGCDAFQDVLTTTSLGGWYNAMKNKVEGHSGNVCINIKAPK